MSVVVSPPTGQAASPASAVTPARSRPERPSQPPTQTGIEVVALRDLQQMEQYIPQWEALAEAACEPNVFYEHWMLLPALRHYGNGRQSVVFVLEHIGGGARPTLLGVIPLERSMSFRGMPLPCTRQWKHPHCYLANPLIARGREQDFWSALFSWLRKAPHMGPLLYLATITADGPLLQSLMAYTFSTHLPLYLNEIYSRALLGLERGSGDDYLHNYMGGDHRRSYSKKKRRLAEKGRIEVCSIQPGDNLDKWLDDFLTVESSGWKRETATAMACQQQDRDFIREISQAAFERRRLMMMSLKLDGKPIAVHHGLHAGSGSFALKIGYDENLGYYSPGMLLEIEVIHALHKERPCHWVDCCSAAGSLVMKRIWKQHRLIAGVVCSTGKPGGHLMVSALPVAQYLRHRLRSLWPWHATPRAE